LRIVRGKRGTPRPVPAFSPDMSCTTDIDNILLTGSQAEVSMAAKWKLCTKSKGKGRPHMKKLKPLQLKKVTLKDLDQASVEGIAAAATGLNSCAGRHTCPGGGCTAVGMRCVGEVNR
jgi:hypothetical protein